MPRPLSGRRPGPEAELNPGAYQTSKYKAYKLVELFNQINTATQGHADKKKANCLKLKRTYRNSSEEKS